MVRKILSWMLIVLSVILLLLSLVGIGTIWIYKEPLTRQIITRLQAIDAELAQAQTTLQSSQAELERTLRIVDAAQEALSKLAQQSTSAKSLFQNIQGTLDDQLLPDLKTTRERIASARTALESLKSALEGVSSFIPSVDLKGPDQILTNLIDSTNSLDAEIANVQSIAKQASTFVSDTSYLLGGDFTQTRTSLENFLAATKAYQQKVTDWRTQVKQLLELTPTWINRAAISLTIFLAWFALSQFGLLMHGLSIRRGNNPLEVLRRKA